MAPNDAHSTMRLRRSVAASPPGGADASRGDVNVPSRRAGWWCTPRLRLLALVLAPLLTALGLVSRVLWRRRRLYGLNRSPHKHRHRNRHDDKHGVVHRDDSAAEETNAVAGLVLVPHIGKSGSDALGPLLAARNEYHGGASASDPAVTRGLRRRGCHATKGSAWPFWAAEEEDPALFFWKVAPDAEACVRPIVGVARSLWEGRRRGKQKQEHEYGGPLPVVKMTAPCPPETRANNHRDGESRCRRLVQFRDPVSWVESHYDYFCVRCRDKKMFCGRIVDANCGPDHIKKGDHETIQEWARKFGNIFVRMLHDDNDDNDHDDDHDSDDNALLDGGTYGGGLHAQGWSKPLGDPAVAAENALEAIRREGHCAVASEDPKRMTQIAKCLGDPPDLYARLGFGEDIAIPADRREGSAVSARERLGEEVVEQLEEILSADVKLYDSLFPDTRTTTNTNTKLPKSNPDDTEDARPLFLLHVGPYKTGSTTLQCAADWHRDKLRQDNFHYLGTACDNKFAGDGLPWSRHLLNGQCGNVGRGSCSGMWRKFRKEIKQHRAMNHSVILSDEMVDDEDNPEVELFLKELIRDGWRGRVVMNYRRLHERAPSQYTQIFSNPKSRKSIPSLPTYIKEWILPDFEEGSTSDSGFDISKMFHEYSKWFEDVKVFNMHANHTGTTLGESFFCEVLPEAENFCRSLSETKDISQNTREDKVPTYAFRFAEKAIARGWIHGGRTLSRVEKIEKFVSSKQTEMPTKCLSEADVKEFLNASLQMERTLLPAFFESSSGKARLVSSFEEYDGAGKFCSMDVSKIMGKDRAEEWIKFFRSME